MSHIKSRKHAVLRQASRMGLATAGLALGALPAFAADQAAEPAKDQVMPAIRATGEGASIKPESVASPKFTQPLVDTPQTITVIKKELMQQQNATTLTEALRNTPGITLLLGENGSTQTGDAIVMRGFDTSASIFVDNIRDLGAISRDMFNIEQVEVVKGPSGADNGRGASSGYINLVTKAPTLRDSMSGSITAGSASRTRITADLDKKFDIGAPGTAFRLNVMKDEGGVPGRDEVKNNTWAIAPSLAIGLGTATRATFYYLHNETHNKPDAGVPTVGLPGFVDVTLAGRTAAEVNRSNYYGSNDDFNDIKVDMFTAKIEHDFAPGLSLTNTSRIGRSHQRYMIGGFSGTNGTACTASGTTTNWLNACDADPANWTVLRTRQISDRTNDILTNQTNISSEFVAGGLKHNLSGGVELIYEKQDTPTYTTAGTVPAANLYDPSTGDAFAPVNLAPTGAFSKGSTLTAALYAFDTLTLNDKWKLNAGVRWEKFKTDSNSVALATAANNPTLPLGTPVPSSFNIGDDLLSWKIGALYKPTENGSFYVSAANSKLPPGSANFSLNATAGNANNAGAKAQEGTNLELGTKWDLLDGKLAVAGAVYRSENKNELVQDPITPGVYTAVGKRRVQGVELSAAGQLSPVWDINLGLGTMDAKIVDGFQGATNPTQGGLLQWTPKLAFTAWTTYKLPFGVTVGGGARYIDSVVRTSATTAQTSGITGSDAYWVADAMAAYTINKNVTLQLNIYNLFDKDYVAAINNSGKRYTPGAPRSALLTANMKF